MKLIIEIDKEKLKEVNRCGLFLNPRDKENLVNSIKHGTPIPDNATNGEVIKALFPSFDYEDKTEYFGRIRNLDDHFIKADIDWWNSPYKRG